MHNHPTHQRDTDTVGATWLRNGTTWLDAPTGRTVGRYAGKHVTTEWGDGVILDLTGRSVTIELDVVEYDLIPTGTQSHISIVRGTYGWDRFVAANPSVFS